MEHANPLLRGNVSPKFITIGEIMLRLTPPNYDKIRVASTFEASCGGSEANIALANPGIDAAFFDVVPNSSLGKSALRMLRGNDVHPAPMTPGDGNITDDAESIRNLMNMSRDIKR